MLHSHTRLWVHLILATKNRQRILFKDAGRPLYEHLLKKAAEEKIVFEQLNIQPEHIHGLIDLPPDKCLSDFVKIIKGESAHWINENKLIPGHFNWQRGYGAYSVSASQLRTVIPHVRDKIKQNITNTRHLPKNMKNGNVNIAYLMISIKSPLKRTTND